MTPIPTLRADLATLKDRRDVSGPLALFLGAELDRIEAMERPNVVYGPTKHPAGWKDLYAIGLDLADELVAKYKTNEGAKA